MTSYRFHLVSVWNNTKRIKTANMRYHLVVHKQLVLVRFFVSFFKSWATASSVISVQMVLIYYHKLLQLWSYCSENNNHNHIYNCLTTV